MTDDQIKMLAKFMVYLEDGGIMFSYKKTHHELTTAKVIAEFILQQEDS